MSLSGHLLSGHLCSGRSIYGFKHPGPCLTCSLCRSPPGADHDVPDSPVSLAGQPGFWSVAGLHSPPATASPASPGSGGESPCSDRDLGLPTVEESSGQQPESHQHECRPLFVCTGLPLVYCGNPDGRQAPF